MGLLAAGRGKTGESIKIILRRRGLRYFMLALVDVEANYLTHRALQYTTLTGVQVNINKTSQSDPPSPM